MRISLSRFSQLCEHFGITPLSVYQSCISSNNLQYWKRKWESAQADGYISCRSSALLYSITRYFEENFCIGRRSVIRFIDTQYIDWFWSSDEDPFQSFFEASKEEALISYFKEMEQSDKDRIMAIAFILANKKRGEKDD